MKFESRRPNMALSHKERVRIKVKLVIALTVLLATLLTSIGGLIYMSYYMNQLSKGLLP